MYPSFLLPLTLLVSVLDATYAGHLVPRDSNASALSSSSKLSTGWYPGWRAAAFPVSKIPWAKYNHLTYAFGTTAPDPGTITLEESDQQALPQFVSAAHQHNVTASLAIGGWGGSRYFSSAMGSPQNRTSFIKAITDTVQKYGLDGVDFDWEFPNNAGIGCNVFSGNDTPNFLSLLQELRQNSIGSKLILSAAVFVKPWNDTSQNPITNVSGFVPVLDWIEVMNYDIFNLWAPVAGPNAPLNDSCADHQRGSAVSAVDLWTKAGMPKEKILLGVPMYGRSFTVPRQAALGGSDNKTINFFPSYRVQDEQLGDGLDGSGPDICGVNQVPTGTYAYQGLMDKNQLKSDGTVAGGNVYRWDDCSQTNFIYNSTSQVYINYDDPKSFGIKGSFINDNGLKGFAAWDVTMDHNTDLIDSMLNALSSHSSLNISSQTSSGSSSSPNAASDTRNSIPIHRTIVTAAGLTATILLSNLILS